LSEVDPRSTQNYLYLLYMKPIVLQCIMCFFLSLMATELRAQKVGGSNMQKMNSLLQSFGAVKMEQLNYMENYGIVEQRDVDATYRFRMKNLGAVRVKHLEKSYSVSLICSEDECISQMLKEGAGKSIKELSFYFTDAKAANSFAKYCAEILIKDFKLTPDVVFYKKEESDEVLFVDSKPKPKVKKKEKKEEPKLLNVKKVEGEIMPENANGFCKSLITILNSGNSFQGVQGPSFNGAYQSREQMPRAQKNYINTYKGASAFIAEFKTSKKSEDLEDLYFSIQDELDACLSQDWDSEDMSAEEVYAGMQGHIFHTEYFKELKGRHISLLILPDTKNYTMFMRIGRR